MYSFNSRPSSNLHHTLTPSKQLNLTHPSPCPSQPNLLRIKVVLILGSAPPLPTLPLLKGHGQNPPSHSLESHFLPSPKLNSDQGRGHIPHPQQLSSELPSPRMDWTTPEHSSLVPNCQTAGESVCRKSCSSQFMVEATCHRMSGESSLRQTRVKHKMQC